MLKPDMVQFLLEILLLKNANGAPFVTVGVENAQLAADTLRELRTQATDQKEPT